VAQPARTTISRGEKSPAGLTDYTSLCLITHASPVTNLIQNYQNTIAYIDLDPRTSNYRPPQ
jgi:hypothetical protein